MDEFALSLKMQRLTRWLDQNCQPDHLARMQFDAPPFGHCYLTIDTERQGPLASFNFNRVYLCGKEAGMDPGSVGQCIALFAASGVKKFFVWLSPGPDMAAVRGWLEAHGFSQIHASLIRRWFAPAASLCVLAPNLRCARSVLRKSKPRAINSAKPSGRNMRGPRAGMASFITWRSTERARSRPPRSRFLKTSAISLSAATREADRKRGAQQALIAKRIERAAASRLPGAGFRDAVDPRTLPAQPAARRLSRDL